MGTLFSCCRRKTHPPAREARPLLNKNQVDQDGLDVYRRAGQIIGALRAGKYPSQDQLQIMLQRFLSLGPYASTDYEDEPNALCDSGDRMFGRIRELVEATVQFGMEKNCAYFLTFGSGGAD